MHKKKLNKPKFRSKPANEAQQKCHDDICSLSINQNKKTNNGNINVNDLAHLITNEYCSIFPVQRTFTSTEIGERKLPMLRNSKHIVTCCSLMRRVQERRLETHCRNHRCRPTLKGDQENALTFKLSFLIQTWFQYLV
jgi:hypothetical protein